MQELLPKDSTNVKADYKDGFISFLCPACGEFHHVSVDSPNAWSWNRSLESPTVEPSIRVSSVGYGPENLPFTKYNGPFPTETHPLICHFFIKNGLVEFCSDSTYLAGETVEMLDWPCPKP